MFAGMQDAQICRNDELMPNDLLPNISRVGIINPINGPAKYHGHGFLIISIILLAVCLN